MTVESHRLMAMEAIHETATWKNCWSRWQPEVLRRTSNLSDAQKLYDLGTQLREIFEITSTGTRSQSDVSSAGAAWECLVCWYLNLIFSGTRAVAMRRNKRLVPSILLDATAVSYGTTQTNTESDLCVVVYPPGFAFPTGKRRYKENLDNAARTAVGSIELGVIQCKTSWADNAQIPMLWDMVYRGGFKPSSLVHIGRHGVSIKHLKNFTYSFATVPTQRKTFKPTMMAVKRVSSLSGGNFWGMPTSAGVALSLSEIFIRNFSVAFDKPVPASVADAITHKVGLFC